MNITDGFLPIQARKPYEHKNIDIQAINDLLISYGILVDSIIEGARIIQYRATLKPTVNTNKLLKLEPNLKIALNCDDVTINIKGNQFIISKPGNNNTIVLKEFCTNEFNDSTEGLKLIMGVDIDGNHIYTDLQKQPHMLVAGTTGSGKSMFLHQVIASLFMNHPTIDIYAVDTKMVEFSQYTMVSNFHYVTDALEAVKMLNNLVHTMEKRYEVLASHGYRDIGQANENGLKINPIVCIIDEFSDLIMRKDYTKNIEQCIVKLAQKSRAAGIHLVIATQRPTSDVITGLIKANIPSRVCMKVNSASESRIVMDTRGGETLLGHGDMYFKGNGSFEPIRLQACYVCPQDMKVIGVVTAYNNYMNYSQAHPVTTKEESDIVIEAPQTTSVSTKSIYSNAIIEKRKHENAKQNLFSKLFSHR